MGSARVHDNVMLGTKVGRVGIPQPPPPPLVTPTRTLSTYINIPYAGCDTPFAVETLDNTNVKRQREDTHDEAWSATQSKRKQHQSHMHQSPCLLHSFFL